MMLAPAGEGFLLGLSLIVAIGAQNAFVLRQGLLRQHVLAVCLICAVSDALLIAAGIAGFGVVVERQPGPAPRDDLARVRRSWSGTGSAASGRRCGRPACTRPSSRRRRCARRPPPALALTWLNPHVYLDTVVLLGGIASRLAPPARIAFGLGAALASFGFFFALGYGARLLTPLFARPAAWRWLDAGVGVTMWLLAFWLASG